MSITQLPAAPSRQDPQNFAQAADSFLTALPQFVAELNTTADSIEASNALNTTYATTASTNSSSSTTLLSETTALSNALERVYMGSKSSNPAAYNDSTALQTGALYWNTPAGELRYWDDTTYNPSWRAIQSITVANTAISNIATANSHINAAALDRAEIFDIKNDISSKYIGTGTSSNIPGNNGQVTGSMYWNTDLNKFLVWDSSSWIDLQTSAQVLSSGDTMTGPLTVPSITTDYYTIGAGIGIDASASDRLTVVGSIDSAKTISGGVLDVGDLILQTVGPQDLSFNNSVTVVGHVAGNTFLTCMSPPPSGCYATLILVRDASNTYDTRTVTFSTGFRVNPYTATFGWSTANDLTVIIRFISDGNNLLEIDRVGPYAI